MASVKPNSGSTVSRLSVWGTKPSRNAKIENAASNDPDAHKKNAQKRGGAGGKEIKKCIKRTRALAQ